MRRILVSLSLSAVLAACSTPLLLHPTAGSMAVRVDWSSSTFGIKAIPAETQSIALMVYADRSLLAAQTLTKDSPQTKFEKLPIGDVLVLATATNAAGKMLAAAKTTVVIEGGKTSRAELELGPPELVKDDLTNLLGTALLDLFKGFLDGWVQPTPAPTPSGSAPIEPRPSESAPPLRPSIAFFERFVLEGISNPTDGPAMVETGSVVKGYMRVGGDIDLSTAKAFAAIRGPEGPQFIPLDMDLSQFEGSFSVDMTGLDAIGDYTVVVSLSDAAGHSLVTPPMQFRLVEKRP